jgi:cytochrome c oxidase subunit 3
MLIALGSWAMLFASLFFAWAALRLRAPEWPPAGTPRLPIALPAFNTAVLLASGFVLRAGLATRTAGARARGLLGTLALGVLFLGLQLAVWIPLWRSGFTVSSGVAGSIFYALTVLHALHVAGGLVALAALLPLAGNPSFEGRGRVVAMYWDFMAAVWLLVFLAVYVA